MSDVSKDKRFRIGWLVFAGLAILTAAEFGISTAVPSPVPYLTVTAIVKAGLIVTFFMHAAELWRREEGAE